MKQQEEAHVSVRPPALSESRRLPMFDDTSREKALASRKARIEAGAKYRRDWLDADNWASMAQKRGIRLPAWYVPHLRLEN